MIKSKIFEIEELNELEHFLLVAKSENLIDELHQDLLIYADYKNAQQWNKAVRICESLTILGWGNHEPIEAIKSTFF